MNFKNFSTDFLNLFSPAKRRQTIVSCVLSMLVGAGMGSILARWFPAEPEILPGEPVAASMDSIVKIATAPPSTVMPQAVGGDKPKVSKRDSTIAVKHIEKSPNKNKDCEEILQMYQSLVEEYEKSPSREVLLRIKALKTQKDSLGTVPDIIYNFCTKNPEYQKRFHELDERLNK